jgi:hypothetical protein
MPARAAGVAAAGGDGGLVTTQRIGLADLMQLYGYDHPHKKEMHKAFDRDPR